MLIGSYQHTVDEKGRIFMPSKIKDDLGERFYVLRGFNRNIMAFSEKEFGKFEAKYQQLPLSDLKAQKFFRAFFASAAECSCDKQGRVVLPLALREYAGITDNVTVVGMISRIEIWDTAALNASVDIPDDEYASTLSELAQLGL